MDSINLRHRQCPLLPPRSSQEFCNVSNFSSQLLTVNRKIIEIIEHHKLYISQKALLIQKIIIHYSLQINVQLILSNFLLNIITRYIFYNWSSCAVYMKQTTHYIENVHSKDHPTLQQNTNHKFITILNTDLQERRHRTTLLIRNSPYIFFGSSAEQISDINQV